MRMALRFIKQKLGFLVAVIMAAVVGGLTTNLVRADIPDSNGQITACYRNNGGDLHVIDTEATPAETYSNQETALSWNELSPEAYIYADYNSGTSSYIINNARSHGIIDFSDHPGDGMCIEVGFTPHLIIDTAGINAYMEIKQGGSWSGSNGATSCSNEPNANVFLIGWSDSYGALIK